MFTSAYFFHLFFGAFVICGFFAITRGDKIAMPDGSTKYVGKIFKGWYFYWMEEVSKKYICYTGDRLKRIVLEINAAAPYKLMVINYNDSSVEISGKLDSVWQMEMERRFNVVITAKDDDQNTILFISVAEPVYRHPWYLRDMLAGCITCHSSWLGTICFWVPVIFTHHYLWMSVPMLLFVWISYCISLAFITTGLWKKFM